MNVTQLQVFAWCFSSEGLPLYPETDSDHSYEAYHLRAIMAIAFAMKAILFTPLEEN
jgi:hypothetical protein